MKPLQILKILFILKILILTVFAEKQATLGGMDGFVERMGAGVRELSLGKTGSADTLSLPGAYWNPGLLGFRRSLGVGLGAENRSLERHGGSLAIESNLGRRVGVGFGLLFRGDHEFAVVDEDDQDLGTASPSFLLGYVGLGYRLSRKDGLGIALSIAYDNLDVAGFYNDIEMAGGQQSPVAFDVGWARQWNAKWSTSVVARNLGLNSKLSASWRRNPSRDNSLTSGIALRPKMLQVGVAYTAPLFGRTASLRAEFLDYQLADTLLVFDPDWHIWTARLGVEYEVIPKGHIRLGFDSENPSLGLGYEFLIGEKKIPLAVDYALAYEWDAGLWAPLAVGLRTRF